LILAFFHPLFQHILPACRRGDIAIEGRGKSAKIKLDKALGAGGYAYRNFRAGPQEQGKVIAAK
jgi:hypothetical protein